MPESSQKSKIRSALLRYAARILSARPYFRTKLKDKLFQRAESQGFENSGALIDEILADLAGSGYLDDRYLAEAYIRRQLGKGYGPKIIALKLKYLGLDPGLVTSTLKAEAGQEAEMASIRKYSAKFPRLDRRKLISKLYQRGYLSLTIQKAFDGDWLED